MFVTRTCSNAISIDAKSKIREGESLWQQTAIPTWWAIWCPVSPSSSMPLCFNFSLKHWTVWMWNSRRNLAEAAEFHIGSTWMKHSTQPCSKPGPCLPKVLFVSASLDWKPNPKPGDFWTLEALLSKYRSCQTRALAISTTSTVTSRVYTFLSVYSMIFWEQVEV